MWLTIILVHLIGGTTLCKIFEQKEMVDNLLKSSLQGLK